MDLNILGNLMNLNKEKECIVLSMEMFIWGRGNLINFMVMVFMPMQMDKHIMENSKKARKMEEGHMRIKVVLNMKDNGKKIEKMDLEFIIIPIMIDTKVIG